MMAWARSSCWRDGGLPACLPLLLLLLLLLNTAGRAAPFAANPPALARALGCLVWRAAARPEIWLQGRVKERVTGQGLAPGQRAPQRLGARPHRPLH
jgi:hypothetical protein